MKPLSEQLTDMVDDEHTERLNWDALIAQVEGLEWELAEAQRIAKLALSGPISIAPGDLERDRADMALGRLVRRMPELESGEYGGVHLSYRKDDPPFWHWWRYGQEGEPIPVASCADTPEECLAKALEG